MGRRTTQGETMLIIWGWRAIKAVIGTGVFFCPACQTDRGYRHIHPRRWFTLFFIPMIPLNELEPYVECDSCHGAFVEQALQAPTAAQLGHMLGLAWRAAVAHLVASVGRDRDGRRHRGRLPARRRGPGPGRTTPGACTPTLRRSPRPVPRWATSPRWPGTSHRTAARTWSASSSCSRTRSARRRRRAATAAVDEIAAALQLSPAHVAGIRQQVLAGRPGGGAA